MMEKALDFVTVPKSYEKELQSDEPFVRAMYEDLEVRIAEFEEEAIKKNEKTSIRDFAGVTVIMALLTVLAFLF